MEQEEALVRRAQAGDADAFGALYDVYVEQVYRFVFYKTMHKEIAEDIVSDVFIKALEHIGSYTPQAGASFSSWLYTIARNRVIDFYRSKKTGVHIEDIFDIPHDAEIAEHSDAKELLSKIHEYVKTLNVKQREIVLLRIWEDMSYKDIARIVGGSEESARMSFSRAIQDMRARFGPLTMIVIFLLAMRYN